MMFQASEVRGKHFHDFLNNDLYSLEPSYSKEGTQLKYFGHSNLLCTRATRAIINHTSIGEYYLYFFFKENFSYLYRNYSIETRHHIFYKYRRFNNYQNLKQDIIGHFVSFLIFKSSVFLTFVLAFISCSFSLVFFFLFTCYSVLCNIVTKQLP